MVGFGKREIRSKVISPIAETAPHDQSSTPLEGDTPLKKRLPLKFVNSYGAELSEPATASDTKLVPPAVPSVFQGSAPVVPSLAEK